jgi:RNA polymerase sigma-70 factor (ECF subfamily)
MMMWVAEDLAIPTQVAHAQPADLSASSEIPIAARPDHMEQDWRDVLATLNGGDDAFARLVSRHQQDVAKQMWRFTRDPAAHEELVHDVFVEAFRSLSGYRSRGPFLHWLRAIATRVGYRFWKRRERSRKQPLLSLEEIGQRVAADASPADAREAAELLHTVFDRLPPRDRLVLTLLYWEGCSVAEAATLAGWSRSMVKVQAHRARKKLKMLLGGQR